MDADSPTDVTVLYDGRRVRVRMRVDEAQELVAGGDDSTNLADKLKRAALARPVRWISAAVLGALVATGIGHVVADHYADKQQRLDLEASLLNRIHRGDTQLRP